MEEAAVGGSPEEVLFEMTMEIIAETALVSMIAAATAWFYLRLRRSMSISTLMLGYAGATVCFGYLMMPYSLAHYGIEFRSYYYQGYFMKSVALFALSFVSMLCLSSVASRMLGGRPPVRLVFRITNPDVFVLTVGFFILVGIAFLAYIYRDIGTAPILAPDPISAKFYLFAQHKITSTLAVNFLSFSNALLVIYFLKTRRKDVPSILMFVVSNLVLLTTMKRAPLLLPYFYLAVAWVLFSNRLRLKHLAVIGSIILAGVGLWYVGELSFSLSGFLSVFSSNVFVEPRELGRVFMDAGPRMEYSLGRTYVVGLFNVVPTSIWDLKRDYYIVRLVARVLGLDYEMSGVPRISMVGEAYLNFGIAGVVLVSGIFMFVVEAVNNYYLFVRSLPLSRRDKMAVMVILAVVVKDLLGFYGSGSSVFLFVYIKLLIAFCLLFWGSVKLYRYTRIE